MDTIAALFFNDDFHIYPPAIKRSLPIKRPALYLRLLCKEHSLDLQLPLLFPLPVREYLLDDSLITLLKESFESNRLLRNVTQKKVYLQLKAGEEWNDHHVSPNLLLIPFHLKTNEQVQGALVFNYQSLEALFTILEDRAITQAGDSKPIIKEERLNTLKKTIYRRLASPPDNLGEIVTTLPAVELQMVLNRVLHKGLASLDMLAAYIYLLDKKGDYLLDNLSTQVREQLFSLLRRQRSHTTIRRQKQVKYVLNRNIFRALGELGVGLKYFARAEELRRDYLRQRVELELTGQPLLERLKILHDMGGLRPFLSLCPQRELAATLSFSTPAISLEELTTCPLSAEISRRGLKMLQEESEQMRLELNISRQERTLMLLRTLRLLKKELYLPRVKGWTGDESFSRRLKELLPSPAGPIFDLAADEIGIARTIYALQRVDEEWLENNLEGVFKTLYEDVTKRVLRFPQLKGVSRESCRKELLIELLILKEEGLV